jgi:divalent metal cation (Fe/Co/Zn/Cd) transporter
VWVVIAAGLIGFAGNELVAVYRIRVGRKIGSAALVADGLHARTDGFTSLAVVVGAIGVLAGFPLADPLVGLLITVAILFVLKGAATDIYRRLMDAVDPDLVDAAEISLRATPGALTWTTCGCVGSGTGPGRDRNRCGLGDEPAAGPRHRP